MVMGAETGRVCLGRGFRYSSGVLSHSIRGTPHGGQSSIGSSYRDEAPVPLTWKDSVNGLWICVMIGETTDGVLCLIYWRHRR